MAMNYNNPLPGVPDIESPFFAELFDSSDAELYRIAHSLNEKGFAVIDFPDPDILSLADEVKATLHDRYDWAAWQRSGRNLRIQDAWQDSDAVRRIATNDKLIRLLSRLYGRQAFPFQTLNFPVGTEQHFHTDSVHFSAKPERFMCGVWVALENVGLDQGPLLYYPGSHKWPIYTNEHIGHTVADAAGSNQRTFEPLWERLVELHGIAPMRFEVKAGQALIWAANLLHGGDAMRDRSRTRWSQVTHYYFEDCVYYTPLASNDPAGQIYHRRPFNIVTGETVDCFYNGLPVSEDYIAASSAPRSAPAPMPIDMAEAGFDPESYLALHHDVRLAGADPWEHYLSHGRAEGRALR